MTADWLVARGDPIVPGAPSELEVLAWGVGIFWALVGAILLAMWWARRHKRTPEARAQAEREHHEHLDWVIKLNTDAAGRHRSVDKPTT